MQHQKLGSMLTVLLVGFFLLMPLSAANLSFKPGLSSKGSILSSSEAQIDNIVAYFDSFELRLDYALTTDEIYALYSDAVFFLESHQIIPSTLAHDLKEIIVSQKSDALTKNSFFNFNHSTDGRSGIAPSFLLFARQDNEFRRYPSFMPSALLSSAVTIVCKEKMISSNQTGIWQRLLTMMTRYLIFKYYTTPILESTTLCVGSRYDLQLNGSWVMQPGKGKVHIFGLGGSQKWEGDMYGQYPYRYLYVYSTHHGLGEYYPGILGFSGIKFTVLRLTGSRSYYFGKTRGVFLGDQPPEIH